MYIIIYSMNTYPKINFNKKEEKSSSKSIEKPLYSDPKFMIPPDVSRLPKPFVEVLEER